MRESQLVSVIIPVLGYDIYLEDALKSIQNQTYRNFEVLLVGTEVVLEEISEKSKFLEGFPVLKIATESSWTLARCLNFAISFCNGQYIARMDSDDISMPKRFEAQVAYLNQHPKVSLCGTWGEVFGEEKWDFKPSELDARLRVELLFGSVFLHPSIMFRASSLDSNLCRYNELLSATEDFDLWTRWINHGQIANVPETLIRYRKHAKSATTRNEELGKSIYLTCLTRMFESAGLYGKHSDLNLHMKLFTKGASEMSEIQLGKAFFRKLIEVNLTSKYFDQDYLVEYSDARFSELEIALFSRVLSKNLPNFFGFLSAASNLRLIKALRLRFPILEKLAGKVFAWLVSFDFGSCQGKERDLRSIVFYNGCPEGESARYRIFNLASFLNSKGLKVEILHETSPRKRRMHGKYDIAVIFRAKYSDSLRKSVAKFKSKGAVIVYDVDDLVFEPEAVDFVGAVYGLSTEEKKFHVNEISLIRRSLNMSDFATTTTGFLAERIEKAGVRTFVIPNSINEKQISIASQIKFSSRWDRSQIYVGIFSGSPTHQKDFSELENDLFYFLKNNNNVRLIIVGHLELPACFNEVAGQIEKIGFQPYLDTIPILANLNFLLVPLETRNPFTDGKSELKIFEAALVGTPVIASAVNSYSKLISNGVNGILVDKDESWLEVLNRVALNPDLGRKLGDNAKLEFVPRFLLSNVGEIALQTYKKIWLKKTFGIDF